MGNKFYDPLHPEIINNNKKKRKKSNLLSSHKHPFGASADIGIKKRETNYNQEDAGKQPVCESDVIQSWNPFRTL